MHYEHMAGTLWFHPVAQHDTLQRCSQTLQFTDIQNTTMIDRLTMLKTWCPSLAPERNSIKQFGI